MKWILAIIFLAVVPSTSTLGGEPKEHIIRIVSDYENLRMYFSPKTVNIKPGDTVTWINEAAEMHNIVSFPDGFPEGATGIASPYLNKKGERWSYTFTVEGTYEYHCLPHLPMGMHGVVIVGRPSTAEEFHRPTKQEVAKYRDKLLAFFDDDEFPYKSREKRQKN